MFYRYQSNRFQYFDVNNCCMQAYVHFCNSGWMWCRSHFGWMEFYNKVQVLDPWDFTSKSTVESSLMDMARHAMLVTHICSIRQLQIDLPGTWLIQIAREGVWSQVQMPMCAGCFDYFKMLRFRNGFPYFPYFTYRQTVWYPEWDCTMHNALQCNAFHKTSDTSPLVADTL